MLADSMIATNAVAHTASVRRAEGWKDVGSPTLATETTVVIRDITGPSSGTTCRPPRALAVPQSGRAPASSSACQPKHSADSSASRSAPGSSAVTRAATSGGRSVCR